MSPELSAQIAAREEILHGLRSVLIDRTFTSRTECGWPVPRLYAPDLPVSAIASSALRCASARSVTWT